MPTPTELKAAVGRILSGDESHEDRVMLGEYVHSGQSQPSINERLLEAAERLLVYLTLHEQQDAGWNGNRFDDRKFAEYVITAARAEMALHQSVVT